MTFNPGVSWFVRFHEHDPSTSDRCIYFTKRGTRCLWYCQPKDNQRAIELNATIRALPAEDVDVELLEEYISCVCCGSGQARHQDRIEDVELLEPLAERWQEEIRRYAVEHSRQEDPAVSPKNVVAQSNAILTPATPSRGYIAPVYTTPTTKLPLTPASSGTNTTPDITVASSARYETTARPPSSTGPETLPHLPSEGQSRYDLRPRETGNSSTGSAVRPKTRSRPPLSEFRPHMKEPGPSDSVSRKLLNSLIDRDFEDGSLYMFSRASSPGHVKIGWTARNVEDRLDAWSECGYTPELLFSVEDVPHAQRVETLTHYELIREWRRERRCKGCGKSHQEWFEVSKERAQQVLSDWAEFMESAEPYDLKGRLTAPWRDFVKATMKKGEAVTAKKLLGHHEALAEDKTLVEESEPTVKIEEQEEAARDIQNLQDLEDHKDPSIRMDSSHTKQSTTTEKTLLEALPKAIPQAKTAVSKEQPKSVPLFKFSPLPKIEFTAERTQSPESGKTFLPDTIAKPNRITAVSLSSEPNIFDFSAPIFTHKPKLRSNPIKSSVPTSSFNPELESATFNFSSPISFHKLPLETSLFNFSASSSSPKSRQAPEFPAPPPKETTTEQEEAVLPVSVADRHHDDDESEQAKPRGGPTRRSGQDEMRAQEKYGRKIAEHNPKPPGNSWDVEETLLEVPASATLEKTAVKIVDQLRNSISSGKVDGLLKASDGLRDLESKLTPAVEVTTLV